MSAAVVPVTNLPQSPIGFHRILARHLLHYGILTWCRHPDPVATQICSTRRHVIAYLEVELSTIHYTRTV
jgi:hypothetical protein